MKVQVITGSTRLARGFLYLPLRPLQRAGVIFSCISDSRNMISVSVGCFLLHNRWKSAIIGRYGRRFLAAVRLILERTEAYMSASNERKKQPAMSDPKTAMEAQRQKAEKRSNLLYGFIGIVFLLVLAASILWRSNFIGRNATAVTIDGEKYTASDMTFFYNNAYNTFLSNFSYYVSMLGLDTTTSPASQTISDTAASMLGVEAGTSWRDYFLDAAVDQAATVQQALKQAEDEGYTYPDSVQVQFDQRMEELETAAAEANMSAEEYLQENLGGVMTLDTYRTQMMRMLQYSNYITTYEDSLTYTDEQIQAAYEEDPVSYEEVSYQYLMVPGTAESTTDEDGNTVEPTDEENEAAHAAAQEKAQELLEQFKAGADLETLADADEDLSYYESDGASYYGTDMDAWLFDDARKSGDVDIVEANDNFYIMEFYDRFLDETSTIDVRHILISPEEGTLSEGDEGYEEEQEQLMSDAVAEAEALLEEWKAGEATEDSFAELANLHSTDGGSSTNGGLYTNVAPGDMVEAFNDWCFDPSRKSGDTGVVETDYGAHVMYFVGTNLPVWKSKIVEELRSEDFDAWFEEMAGDPTFETHAFGMKFVG